MSFQNLRRALAMVAGLAVAFVATSSEPTAFELPQHRNLTIYVLRDVHVTIAGHERRFSKAAIDEVVKANEAVDSILGLSAAWFEPQRHFTNEVFTASTQNLITLKQEILEDLRRERPAGGDARAKLGMALHGIQDFYSHSNWVELGNTGIVDTFGTGLLPNPSANLFTCPQDPNVLGPNGGGGLTSGYYNSATGCSFIATGKCHHGNYQPSCLGINKDRPGFGVPGGHEAAMSRATSASAAFVQQIIDELQGNDKALGALLGLRSRAFVFDTTDSMTGQFPYLKSEVASLVNRLQTVFPSLAPTEWILVPFNDPGVGPPFVTENAADFLAAVNGLVPDGGDDCPEMAMSGLLLAVRTALPNSVVHLITDASAKDSALAGQVISEAKRKNIVISPMPVGSCSPIDPGFYRVAEETGGQVILLNSQNVTRFADIVEPEFSDDLQTIAMSRGALAGSTKSIQFPVDGSVTQLVVSTELDLGLTATLIRPNGLAVAATDPDASIAIIPAIDVATSHAGDVRDVDLSVGLDEELLHDDPPAAGVDKGTEHVAEERWALGRDGILIEVGELWTATNMRLEPQERRRQ